MNKLEHIILDNGLNVYFYEDKRRHSTFFQLVTLLGGTTTDFSVDDKKYHMQNGIAHILEHYVVECNKVGNFIKILGEAGMNTNASTYRNMTKFYFEAVEDVKMGIDTLLKGIYDVSFEEAKLKKIKEPIYQEIRAKMDNKFYCSNLEEMNYLFHNITFRSIGGSLEDVQKTTLNDLKICYQAFYRPEMQYIIVAGNFDKEAVLWQLKEFYKDLEVKKHRVQILTVKEPKTVVKKEGTVYYPTAQDFINIAYKIDVSKLSCRKKLDLDFLVHIFFVNFFGLTSKLYNDLVKDKIITGSIVKSYNQLNNFFIINIGAYTDKPVEFQKRIINCIQRLEDFDKEIFELEKKDIIMDIILRDESILKTILLFVDNLVDFNYPYLDTVKDIEKMTFETYKKAILDLDFSNYTVITLKDRKEKA